MANIKRAKLFTVTEDNKIKGIKDRRNIRALAEIRERIAYDPRTGSFTYRVDCAVGKAGDDAVWRCRRTDCVGTPYEKTLYWELVKFDNDHWYEPRKLAYYFINRDWPAADTWVASGRKYDYSADGLQLVATGEHPVPISDGLNLATTVKPPLPTPGTYKALVIEETTAPKKGFFARVFGM